MKHCPYCGKELPEEMQFCPYCMKKLINEQPVTGLPVKKRSLGWTVIVGGIAVLVAVCALVIDLLPSLPQDVPAGGTTTTTSELRASATVDDVTEAVNGTVGGGRTTAATGGTTTESQNGVVGSGGTTTTKGDTTTKKGNTTTTKKGGTTTTKGKTTKTTKGTSAQGGAVDPCVGGHNWQAITETVEHDEIGHYEQVITGYNTVTIYKCAVCYGTFESLSAYYTHFEEHENSSDALVGIFRDRYETSTKRVPVYGQTWVVDEEAYTEQVVVGHKCSVCGATQ